MCVGPQSSMHGFKEQEKEGFSIPARLKLSRDYALGY